MDGAALSVDGANPSIARDKVLAISMHDNFQFCVFIGVFVSCILLVHSAFVVS